MVKVHRMKKGVVSVSIKVGGFTVVTSTSNSNRSRVWNSLELYATYMTQQTQIVFKTVLFRSLNGLVFE